VSGRSVFTREDGREVLTQPGHVVIMD
jgi:hypothetical protein